MRKLRLTAKQRAEYRRLRGQLGRMNLTGAEEKLVASLARLALKFTRAQVLVFPRHFVRKG